MPPAKPSLQDQIDALTARIEAGEKMRNETHKMVAALHEALMKPQLGQGDKSLLQRMAEVTVDMESGKRTADNLIALGRRLVAIAAFVAAIAAFLKFGQIPRE